MKSLEIIKTLLPTLKLAGQYACNIQSQIQTQPDKDYGENFYATALTDADLTIQTAIELALLAKFPELKFFGEEYAKSYNTKYFRGTNLEDDEELLITLDPIDGTRAYLDNLSCFSIILNIIKNKQYEAVFVLQPRRKHYFYALKGKGAFIGSIDDDLELAKPLKLKSLHSKKIYLSFALTSLKTKLNPIFDTWCSATDYNPPENIPDYLDLINGDLAGFIIGKGNLIDSASLAFVAMEAGAIASHFDGSDFQPFRNINQMKIDGLVIAFNREIHQQILAIVNQ
ncbi:inositol monophosphatase family protein [Cyanobacterium aponinum UTEX 3222]|uniref:inositol monophosphatase family protein n=1 Tax=Cyanobacterium aponinum TaxID=379064 RepID=UPI002B4BD155|nr:inositol monophosphatase family protein [Cyanobacterium aponinum]WRL38116.1 inositol monophosphatase family protein [Cyanobacterium aponinum UTEX 3221]WRL41406.1 inositol monophosphatase family protein [Cyanobacterium aponinum UTEX 3222]